MKTKTYTTIDRKEMGWPAGPWSDEPDKVQWQDPATGLPCLAVRNNCLGNWCGYVGVDANHIFYQVNYQDIDDIEVWCGLTFSAFCDLRKSEATGVCHVPEPGEPDHVWWLGFDCAHCDDLTPHDARYALAFGSFKGIDAERSYKSFEFVKQECTSLAKQLKALCTAF